MKTIAWLSSCLLILTCRFNPACADHLAAGNYNSLGSGVPKKINGGVPKKLDWDTPDKDSRKARGICYGANTTNMRPVQVIVNPAKPEADMRWDIAFCVDEIIIDKGFISRNQYRANEYKQSLFFIVMTNTEKLVRGEWLGGLSGEFRKVGIMTNEFEQLQVIVPIGQTRSINPPKYDR